MKKLLSVIVLASTFAGGMLLANVDLNKLHKDKNGLDGAKINCAYCHDAGKANNPKTKGNDRAALKKGKYCAIAGCH